MSHFVGVELLYDMPSPHGFRNLLVWQKAVQLAIDVSFVLNRFPREFKSVWSSQILRSSASIAANIAEGYGRGIRLDFAKFVRIARGSCNELDTHVEVCKGMGLIRQEDFEKLNSQCREITAMLTALDRRLREA